MTDVAALFRMLPRFDRKPAAPDGDVMMKKMTRAIARMPTIFFTFTRTPFRRRKLT